MCEMGSRIRENPVHIFECFCEVVIPNVANEDSAVSLIKQNPITDSLCYDKRKDANQVLFTAWIIQKFPENYKDEEILKSVPEFAYPCKLNNDTVQHFSFVLTNIDSKWTFGFCRFTPNAPTCVVILSCLPWHDTFYRILNHIATITNDKQEAHLSRFLEALYAIEVPEPGLDLYVSYNNGQNEFSARCPDHLRLPTVPENRNLTEYVNAIDYNNMMVIFASMLQERRIIVVSKKLSRLSSCVQAAESLIYPMHWQHIFIPVLPNHLLDYLSAPMPFLIGVPAITMTRVKCSELGEAVVVDADANKIETPFNDLDALPSDVVNLLKRCFKNQSMVLGDGVARIFMRASVRLIGGYRDALKVTPGEKITFQPREFVQSRPASYQPFLEKMLHLQIFQQFIEGRLDMLNSGIGFSDEFEFEVNMYGDKSSNRLRTQYKEWVANMKKEGGALLKTVRNKVKDKSKRAYKDIRSKLQDMQPNSDMSYKQQTQPKSAPSSPTLRRRTPFNLSGSKKLYSRGESTDGALEGLSISSNKTRRYKMLTIDDISQESEDSGSDAERGTDLSIQRIDMDLMGDLQDLIFRRCSVSSDNEGIDFPTTSVKHSSLQANSTPDAWAPVSTPFHSSQQISSLPAPIPPPRVKRKNQGKPTDSPQSIHEETKPEDAPLIQLESLEDEVFDPLKQNGHIPGQHSSSDNVLSYREYKQPVQNIPTRSLQQLYKNPSIFAQPKIPVAVVPQSQPNPFNVYSISQGQAPFSNEFYNAQPLADPWTPQVSGTVEQQSATSSDDHDLLQEYGLAIPSIAGSQVSRPVTSHYEGAGNMDSDIAKTPAAQNPFGDAFDWKDSADGNPKSSAQSSWQKF